MDFPEPTIRLYDAQFDVHTNLGRNRSDIPYLVDAQSCRDDAASARIVIPLMRLTGVRDTELRPSSKFVIMGGQLVLNPLLLFAAPQWPPWRPTTMPAGSSTRSTTRPMADNCLT